MIGCSARASCRTRTVSTTAATTRAPMTSGLLQPPSAASMMPNTRAPTPRVAASAPPTSNRPGWGRVAGRERGARNAIAMPSDPGEVQLALEVADDEGRTDLELVSTAVTVIVEAKKGWLLPGE